jgi:hypothetical protein
MTVKTMPSVANQPEIVLTDWSAVRISGEGSYWDVLLGWCEMNRCGRVTTPIVEFIAEQATAITRSGRRYRLAGAPGKCDDALYVYQQTFGHVPHKRLDITAEYLEQMARQDSP